MPSRDAIFDILDEFDETGNYEEAYQQIQREYRIYFTPQEARRTRRRARKDVKSGVRFATKPKRKLSAWQKFVKANSKKPRFKYKSGAKKGRINLKALGVAYRKKKRR